MTTLFRYRLLAVIAGFVLVVAACSSPAAISTTAGAQTEAPVDPPDSTSEPAAGDPAPTASPSGAEPGPETSEPQEPEDSAEPAGQNELPDVRLVDLGTGADVTLASFAPADTPIVLWFWAPH